MQYKISLSKAFKKDAKKIQKADLIKAKDILNRLASGDILEPSYKDHALSGNLAGCRDCHIKADLVLVYKINDDVLEVLALRIAKHSELFS